MATTPHRVSGFPQTVIHVADYTRAASLALLGVKTLGGLTVLEPSG